MEPAGGLLHCTGRAGYEVCVPRTLWKGHAMRIASVALLLGWLSAGIGLCQAPAAPVAPPAGQAAGR